MYGILLNIIHKIHCSDKDIRERIFNSSIITTHSRSPGGVVSCYRSAVKQAASGRGAQRSEKLRKARKMLNAYATAFVPADVVPPPTQADRSECVAQRPGLQAQDLPLQVWDEKNLPDVILFIVPFFYRRVNVALSVTASLCGLSRFLCSQIISIILGHLIEPREVVAAACTCHTLRSAAMHALLSLRVSLPLALGTGTSDS